MTLHQRQIVYAAGIMIITGSSKSYACHLGKKIKNYFNKANRQMVTLEEFAEFAGMSVQKVMEYIGWSKQTKCK